MTTHTNRVEDQQRQLRTVYPDPVDRWNAIEEVLPEEARTDPATGKFHANMFLDLTDADRQTVIDYAPTYWANREREDAEAKVAAAPSTTPAADALAALETDIAAGNGVTASQLATARAEAQAESDLATMTANAAKARAKAEAAAAKKRAEAIAAVRANLPVMGPGVSEAMAAAKDAIDKVIAIGAAYNEQIRQCQEILRLGGVPERGPVGDNPDDLDWENHSMGIQQLGMIIDGTPYGDKTWELRKTLANYAAAGRINNMCTYSHQ
ncbi:hypothetical protein [Arthrobacter sp.]|uniref:hypothetical protein n=1 Tax=Arthrobacter sp. TaxID=1667 RepID=UPI003A94852C